MTITFQNWRKTHPFIEDYLIYPDNKDKNCRWARIQANWKEQKTGGKNLSHLCAFTIDLNSGDIYLDCRKRKIWAKCAALTIGRPIFGITKTMYHLALPLSIPIEIYKSVIEDLQKKMSANQILKNSLRSIKHNLTDIIRTPLYSLAMTIVTLSAVIIGPFAPSKLYDLRARVGRLENKLNRGEDSIWNRAPCFQPLENLMHIHHLQYVKKDTQYEDEPSLHGLNNLARSYVKFRRTNRNLFNDCACLQSQDKAYVSAAYAA